MQAQPRSKLTFQFGTPTAFTPVVNQTSPSESFYGRMMEEFGQNLSTHEAGGETKPLEDMAEVTVKRVTRRSSRYQPEATTLRAEVGELQNALLQNRYFTAEEMKQAHAHFESCARNYEVEARDVRDVEVAQTVAPAAQQR
jgi:hypothetical protein